MPCDSPMPNYCIEWSAWAKKNRIADAMDNQATDPFDSTVTGPWLRRWAEAGTD